MKTTTTTQKKKKISKTKSSRQCSKYLPVQSADDSHKGDVDAVSKGFAAISTISAWPQGHAFAILDDVLVESLREVSSSSSSGLVGLPSWLVHIKE